MRRHLERLLPVLFGALAFGAVGCDDEADDFDIDAAIFGDADPGDIEARGYFFVATNDPAGNEVVAYLAFEDGTVVERVRASTGGAGANLTGDAFDPLGSQDSLIFVEDYVFAVNAGSNTVASFEFEERDPDELPRLELLSVESSGGVGPISVTYYDENLFVVNADGSIRGFDVNDGVLSVKADGAASLATGAVPATIEYRLDGDDLLVTNRTGDRLVLIELAGGLPTNVSSFPSIGATPIGAEFFGENVFAVANANAPGGNPVANGSSVSTYEIEDGDPPKTVQPEFPSNQTGAARITWLPGLEWMFTSNQASGSLTSYKLDSDGDLEEGVVTQMPAGSVPLDVSINEDDEHYLFVLDGGRGAVAMYQIDRGDGSLIPLDESAVTGLIPGQAYGLDVYRGSTPDIDSDF
jgi:6-phosphogluconolactonase (cycloisomerase 2 family)